VNAVQSSTPSGKKKKGKSKKKQDNSKNQNTTPDDKRKVKYPCQICGKFHFTRDCPHREEVQWFLKGPPHSAVLTEPFPNHGQQLVQHDSPPQGGNTHHDPAETSSAHVLMCNETIDLTTRTKTCDQTPNSNLSENVKGKNLIDEHSFTPPPSGPLHIEKPISDTILRPPKNTIRKAVFNPNA